MMYPEEVVDKLLRIMATCDGGCHIYIEDRWEREDS